MIASRNQNQFPSSFAPLRDLLKALMFLSNLNDFNPSPSPPDQGFAKQKDSSKVWKEKGSKWFSHFFFLSLSCFWSCITCVFCFLVLSQSSFMHCFVYHVFVCLFIFSVLLYFVFHKKKKNWNIRKIQNQCVFCVHWYLCTLNGYWNKVF